MTSTFLIIGLMTWVIVLADFLLAFLFRRSALRFIWACTALGWPLFFLRELKWVPRDSTWVLAVGGITAGIAFAFLLLVRLVRDPRVLR